MRVRKDGEATRRKILEAACRVFGEKGYRDATHAEICRIAAANTAAINYHFGSKDALYRASWEHAAERAEALYPADGGVSNDAPPEAQLRGLVRALLQRRADAKRLGHFHSIRMMELVNPTGLLDKSLAAWRERARGRFLGVIAPLLGPGATEMDLDLCEMSVVSQCIMAYKGKLRGPWTFKPEALDMLVEHVMRFSMAGIGAMRRQIEAREAQQTLTKEAVPK